MSTEPQVLPPTELALQVRPIPAEVMSRFDLFLLAATDKVEASARALEDAGESVVDSDAEFILADVAVVALKKANEAIKEERLELTRPIDDFKGQFLEAVDPAHKNYIEAIRLLTEKMSAFRAEKRRQAEAAQRDAERILREQKERQEAEARELEERAAKLKTPARAEALMREADEIRQATAMMPASVAVAVSAPETVASSVSETWVVDSFPDPKSFLHWLADHPEWHSILELKTTTRAMNRFADQCHVLEIPGVVFKQKDVYRSKPR